MKDYAPEGTVQVTTGEDIKPVTDQARAIFGLHLPEWAVEFLKKNRKYREVDNSLGAKGVFPDVWRKVGILKSRIWLEHEEIGEDTDEVIRDLIGHLFLMLYMREAERNNEGWTEARVKFTPLPDADDADLLEGQGWALDRAADRSARDGKSATEALRRFDPSKPVRDQLVAAWEDGYEHGDRHEGDNPYKHIYNSLMNCTRCGYAHVGPDDRMYETPCLPRVSAHQSRSEMTVSERMEKDGGRH